MTVVGRDEAVTRARGRGLEAIGARDDGVRHVAAVRIAVDRQPFRIRIAERR